MQTPSRYSFPADLTQAIINTLGARPWHEVHPLMAAIQAEVAQQEAAPPAAPARRRKRPSQAPATP